MCYFMVFIGSIIFLIFNRKKLHSLSLRVCPAPELREVPVRARDGERGHVGGEPLPAGPQAPQLRHGAAGVGGREARQEVPLQPGRTPACSCPWCSPCTPTLSGASSEWELIVNQVTKYLLIQHLLATLVMWRTMSAASLPELLLPQLRLSLGPRCPASACSCAAARATRGTSDGT